MPLPASPSGEPKGNSVVEEIAVCLGGDNADPGGESEAGELQRGESIPTSDDGRLEVACEC